MNHLIPGKWEMGKNIDSIVTREPFEGCCDEKTAEYYGGYVVAESVPACFGSLIAAAPEMYEALIGARGALRLDAMVDERGRYYATTVIALKEIGDALKKARGEE